MTALNIKTDLRRLERNLGVMAEREIKRIVPQSINRTVRSTRAEAVREASRITAIQQKQIRERDIPESRMQFATATRFDASIDAQPGRARNLIRFVTPKQAEPGSATEAQFFRRKSRAKRNRRYLRKGVKAKAWRTPKVYRGTFIARGRGNNPLVFSRRGASRSSRLKYIFGPSVRREFNRPPFRQRLRQHADPRLRKELDRQLARSVAKTNVNR